MNDDERASQHADELALQRDLLETLTAAIQRPLTQSEAELLAWASGMRPDFQKEMHK